MLVASTKPETTVSQKGCFEVLASSLNIRDTVEPKKKLVSKMTNTQSVGNYKQGDTICPLEIDGIWAKTDKGWVSTVYLKKLDS